MVPVVVSASAWLIPPLMVRGKSGWALESAGMESLALIAFYVFPFSVFVTVAALTMLMKLTRVGFGMFLALFVVLNSPIALFEAMNRGFSVFGAILFPQATEQFSIGALAVMLCGYGCLAAIAYPVARAVNVRQELILTVPVVVSATVWLTTPMALRGGWAFADAYDEVRALIAFVVFSQSVLVTVAALTMCMKSSRIGFTMFVVLFVVLNTPMVLYDAGDTVFSVFAVIGAPRIGEQFSIERLALILCVYGCLGALFYPLVGFLTSRSSDRQS